VRTRAIIEDSAGDRRSAPHHLLACPFWFARCMDWPACPLGAPILNHLSVYAPGRTHSSWNCFAGWVLGRWGWMRARLYLLRKARREEALPLHKEPLGCGVPGRLQPQEARSREPPEGIPSRLRPSCIEGAKVIKC
jgi:hypothetical protein